MSRRYTINVRCTFPGCREGSFYEAATRADEARIRRDYVPTWRCTRHTRPEQVLSTSGPSRSTVLVCREIARGDFRDEQPILLGKFWVAEDKANAQPDGLLPTGVGGNGFSYGPGFKAYAEDFPVGTRLVISAHVEIPAEVPA